MKLALTLLLVALAASQVNCFIGRGIGGGFLGRGLGFGFGRFGLGWGGLGWGGWGGPWGPWGFGGPWGWGAWRFGGPWGRWIGKRDVDSVTPPPSFNADKTLCSFTSKRNMITCHGAKHNFECEVEPVFVGLGASSYRVHNLTATNEKITISGDAKEHNIIRLFSHKPEDVSELNDFTLTEKDKEVTFSVYKNDKINENGFRVKEGKCWRSFVTMMKETKPATVKFALFINHVN